jgi:hypothetical protein
LEKAALPEEAFNQAAGVSLGGEGGAVGFMDGVAALGGIVAVVEDECGGVGEGVAVNGSLQAAGKAVAQVVCELESSGIEEAAALVVGE